MPRYEVRDGSESAHCCFQSTVVDTSKPEFIGGEHYKHPGGQYAYKAVCECFSEDDAEKICSALNALESRTTMIPIRGDNLWP